MTPMQAITHNAAYSTLSCEAKNAVHSYLIASEDVLTTSLLAKAFVSFATGVDIDRVDDLKDVYNLPFGDKVLITDADHITETAYIMPSQLNCKYFIVHNFETANESAQNKLLKTLEEPPQTAIIILLCANEYALLPTVRSRCRIVRPSLFGNDVLRSVLETEYPTCENKSFAVAAAGGSLTKLCEVAENGTQTFDMALKLLMCMRKSSEILPYATQLIAKKDQLGDMLDAFELIMRDCMVYSYRPELISLKDNVMDIRELSKSYGANEALREFDVISRARKRISMGGNVNSIVDELLFSLLEEKAKCQK